MAGTAFVVWSLSVVALRKNVASSASVAKFGYRSASIRPRRSSSEVSGSSSKTTMTTGAVAETGLALATSAPGRVSRETGERTRKRTAKTSGAGASTVRNERTPATRA